MRNRQRLAAGIGYVTTALLSLVLCMAPATARADMGQSDMGNVALAQSFVENLSVQGIDVLADKSLSRDQRIAKFRAMLQNDVDIPRIARFTLGRYWRTASVQQREEFKALFQDWLLSNYVARFADYSGQTITVTGGQTESDSLVVVRSRVNQTNGAPPVDVDWRIWVQNGQGRVVDVVVEGVSMAITLRSQFDSVIQNNGGSVSALLTRMRAAVAPAGGNRTATSADGA
jgi:phospholipid transport system substrate-binding protein